MNNDKWVKVEEAAEYCGVNKETIKRAARQDKLLYTKAGNSYRFKKGNLDAWLLGVPQEVTAVKGVETNPEIVLLGIEKKKLTLLQDIAGLKTGIVTLEQKVDFFERLEALGKKEAEAIAISQENDVRVEALNDYKADLDGAREKAVEWQKIINDDLQEIQDITASLCENCRQKVAKLEDIHFEEAFYLGELRGVADIEVPGQFEEGEDEEEE